MKIRNMSSSGLAELSRKYTLSLTIEEMERIKEYFTNKKREPTRTELESIAQTWSEHCKHKTMAGSIVYLENGKKYSYDNLLQETVFKTLETADTGHCLSVFKDNAGIIKFTDDTGIAMKVETHNHPSAIEPYGGASTGVGGVIRDILGAGLGARPILNIDVFCFGPRDIPHGDIEEGILHPSRIFKGVVKGVRDYSNRMGIPTASGAIIFDESYIYNPLVYCGTVGVIPQKYVYKKVKEGDIILSIGGKTGRDGLHGATFSSAGLDEEANPGCVQIGDPVTEKKFADVLLKLRDEELYNAITDCGAGGLSSAVGELGAETGACVKLEKIRLKEEGLDPWEIFLSESQERMVLSVPPKNLKRVCQMLESEDTGYEEIGVFAGGSLKVFYGENPEAELDMDFLHSGYPKVKRSALWNDKTPGPLTVRDGIGPEEILERVFGHPDIASKEKVISQYDHEVQGGAVIRPMEGINRDMPQDGCVIRPFLDKTAGIAVGLGINPFYGRQDPFSMAASVTEEAVRNAVSCGGDIRRAGLMDNFCWGDTSSPEILGELVRACRGCCDAARILGIPFVSGKDSLNNFYINGKKEKINIPGTLLISCVAPVEDIEKSCGSSFIDRGSIIYLVGNTYDELGESIISRLGISEGGRAPALREESKDIVEFIRKTVSKGSLRSCRDLSEGGFAAALAEMSFSGIGAEIDISEINLKGKTEGPGRIIKLFSESNSRFLIEVSPKDAGQIEKYGRAIPLFKIGKTIPGKNLKINDGREKVIDAPLAKFKDIYTGTLKW